MSEDDRISFRGKIQDPTPRKLPELHFDYLDVDGKCPGVSKGDLGRCHRVILGGKLQAGSTPSFK
jgi:hypothetical protein